MLREGKIELQIKQSVTIHDTGAGLWQVVAADGSAMLFTTTISLAAHLAALLSLPELAPTYVSQEDPNRRQRRPRADIGKPRKPRRPVLAPAEASED